MKKPCFPNGIKEFPFTPEDIRDIWLLAKEEFARTGDIGKTVQNLSDKIGLDPYHVAQAITKPKTIPRTIAKDAWIKASQRMRIVNGAKAIVSGAQRTPIMKALDTVYNIPRNLATLYHWGVFTMTHGGELAFAPSEYGRFFPQFVRGWRAISPSYFDEAIKQHQMRVPNHSVYSAAGLDNNPYSHAVGIFEKGPSTQWLKPGARGYGTLAMARDDLMDNLVKRANRIVQREGGDPNATILNDKEQLRALATIVNHVWGSVKLPPKFAPFLSKLVFATRLWPARLMSTFADIPKAGKTFATWQTASAADRVAALFTARRVAQVLIMHHSMVAANAAYNKFTGGPDINMVNPGRVGDFMAFKIGGLTIRPPSAILEAERVLGGMAYASVIGGTKTAGDVLKDYISGKLNPMIHLGQEVASGVTWAGDRIPFKGLHELITGNAPVDKFNREITKQESPGQYVAERTLPIPAGGAAREIYEIFKQEGLRSEEASAWMRALDPKVLGIAAIESQGITAKGNYEYKNPPSFLPPPPRTSGKTVSRYLTRPTRKTR